MIIPSSAENIFWIATISTNLSTLFIVFSILTFIKFRDLRSQSGDLRLNLGSYVFYLTSLLLATLAFFSYEPAGVLLPLILLTDIFFLRKKVNLRLLINYLPFALAYGVYSYLRISAGSVGLGGDYSYSIVNFIPNALGNLIGYLGLHLVGQNFIVLYNFLRSGLRDELHIVALGISVFMIISSWFFYRNRIFFRGIFKNEDIRKLFYLFIFSVISLIPFLGLGNISERYSYTSAVAFSIGLAFIIHFVSERIYEKSGSKNTGYWKILVFLTIVIGATYVYGLSGVQKDWEKSSKITQRTLSYLRLYHEDLSANTVIYFANVPIREGNAWVFPVGLSDGAWFVYRDESIRVEQVTDVDEALDRSQGVQGLDYIILYFDEEGMVNEHK